MRKKFKASISKDLEFEGSNEDGVLLLLRENRLLMLDGASDSYAARTWVKCVSDGWRRAPEGVSFLESALESYNNRVKQPENWAKAAAFERGSFCTFLEVRFDQSRNRLDIRAVGDTCVLGIDESGILLWGYPHDSQHQFTSVPFALSSDPQTLRKQHELLLAGSRSFSTTIGSVFTIILATDAVAGWLLIEDRAIAHSRIQQVLALRSKAEFLDLVTSERLQKRMRLDDSTIAILEVQDT